MEVQNSGSPATAKVTNPTTKQANPELSQSTAAAAQAKSTAAMKNPKSSARVARLNRAEILTAANQPMTEFHINEQVEVIGLTSPEGQPFNGQVGIV